MALKKERGRGESFLSEVRMKAELERRLACFQKRKEEE